MAQDSSYKTISEMNTAAHAKALEAFDDLVAMRLATQGRNGDPEVQKEREAAEAQKVADWLLAKWAKVQVAE